MTKLYKLFLNSTRVSSFKKMDIYRIHNARWYTRIFKNRYYLLDSIFSSECNTNAYIDNSTISMYRISSTCTI